MVLFADAISSITVGKIRRTLPARKNIIGALSGNKAEAISEAVVLPKIKTCQEIMAELNRKPLKYYTLNGRPILFNLGENIRLK